jgi:hypothetical protein
MDRERRGWDVEDRDIDYEFRDREREDQQQHDFDTLAEADRMNAANRVLDFVLGNPDLLNDPAAIEGFNNMLYELFPNLRPRTTPGNGGSSTSAGRPANATSTPMGGGGGRPTGNPTPAPDPSGVTAGPAPTGSAPPPRPTGSPTGPDGMPRNNRGARNTYRSMRNMGAGRP